MARQEYTISHTGSVLEDAGEDAVSRYQNQISPQRRTEILRFRCPSNFDRLTYESQRHPVRFIPRTHEGPVTDPGESYDLNTRIQPVAGEPKLEDQPYPSVVVVDSNGNRVEPASVDNALGVVHFDSALTGDYHFFPIITQGTISMRVLNTLNQDEGPLYQWEWPIYRWHDMKQDKRGTEVNLNGAASIKRDEKLEVQMDSPDQIVWENANYPGAFVSTLEMDVTITL